MIKHASQMTSTVREQMRDGKGEVTILDIVPKAELTGSRLFSKISLPVGASIGEHDHTGETEYYYILSGTGTVYEEDGPKQVLPGDVVITGNGASHGIENTGGEPLEFIALILLEP